MKAFSFRSRIVYYSFGQGSRQSGFRRRLGIPPAVAVGVVAQHFLLVRDGVALLIAAIITTETAVESGNSGELLLLVGLLLVRLH